MKHFQAAHLNISSLFLKFNTLKHILAKELFDILSLSETWLNSSIPDNQIDISGIRKDRGTLGGGVAIYL